MIPTVIRRLARASRKFDPTWRYVFNLAPTLSYRLNSPSLTGESLRVLRDLNRDGVAITSIQALLGSDSCCREMYEAVEGLQSRISDRIAEARTQASDSDAIGGKTFLLEYLGRYPALDPNDIYGRFALQKNVLQIANAYLGMYTRLRYYNIWHTFASQGQARESQLWHRDREDRYILKMFLYISDVDESAGPFTYAAGSHLKGSMRREPAYFLEDSVKRSDDSQMAKAIPERHWIKAVGPKGTIVFADTHGYHKGGLARERDRIMYTCMFTSPASESREFFKRPDAIPRPSDREQAFALAAYKRGAWLSLKPGGFASAGDS